MSLALSSGLPVERGAGHLTTVIAATFVCLVSSRQLALSRPDALSNEDRWRFEGVAWCDFVDG